MRQLAFVCFILLGAMVPSHHASAQDTNGTISSGPNNQSDADIRAYWTPERMRAAKPMPMPSPPPGWQSPTTDRHSLTPPPYPSGSAGGSPGNEGYQDGSPHP